MSNAALTRVLLPAAVLLPLCLGAGYLGAVLHGPSGPQVDAPAGRASGGVDFELREYIAEVERRNQVLVDRVEQSERAVTSLGNQLQEVRTRLETVEQRPGAAAVAAAPESEGVDAPPLDKTEMEIKASLHEQFAKRMVATQKVGLDHQFKTLADTSGQGELDRKANAYAEATAVFKHFGADDEATRQIYVDYYRRLATEVGPLVGSGLEGADLGSVRPRYLDILDDRNAKVANLLEGKALERWNDEQTKLRKILAQVLTK